MVIWYRLLCGPFPYGTTLLHISWHCTWYDRTILSEKANTLHGEAGNLEGALGGDAAQTARGKVTALKDAASKASAPKGLKQLIEELNGASGISDIVAKVKSVIDKFNSLKSAYEAVAADEKAKTQQQLVEAVTTEYTELKTIYDGMLNLTKLKNKAKTLNSTAAGQSGTELSKLENKPSELATKAQALSEAANGLVGDPQLGVPAGLLKNAAKKDGLPDNDSLHKKATQLQTSTDYANTKEVIEAFDNVKTLYDALIKQAITNDKLSLVQNVISKFEDLKNHYDTMMPFTKIKYYSGDIETQAGNLRTSGSTTDADNIVRYFESMEYAYSNLTEEQKKSVKVEFLALNTAYGHIIIHYPKILQNAAGPDATGDTLRALALALYTQANELNTAVSNVSGSENAARVLRHKAGTNAQKDDPKYLRKLASDLYDKASTLENAAPAGTGDKDLKQKAGTNPDDGLRKLASELYDAAKALADSGASDSGKARELATAVGNSETDTGRLREKLAQLARDPAQASAVTGAYETVQGLFIQVQGKQGEYTKGDQPSKYQAVKKAWEAFNDLYTANLKNPANALAEAVGDSSTREKLQGALAELCSAPDGPDLTSPAGAVKNAYHDTSGGGVKPKFKAVEAKGSSYQAIAAIRSLYDDVVSAMTAFDNVYKPEELLKDTVGENDKAPTSEGPKTLREALNQLGSSVQGTDLSDLAKDVKEKYSKFDGSGVKQKFELVKA